jgi:hypothetical protein
MCLSPLNGRTGRPAHAHYFCGTTGEALQHVHFVEFFTFPVNGNDFDRHTHQFQGITRYSLLGKTRHLHRFTGYTGPAITRPDGSHYHEIHWETDDEPFLHLGNFYRTVLAIKRHKHSIDGRTGPPIGSVPDDW